MLIEKGAGVLCTQMFAGSPQAKRIRNAKKAFIYKDGLTYPEYPQP
jgi:hypothetical protein